jgi:hypothetical protein
MKKFVRFYYRCSFKVFLWAVLSLIGFTVLSSSAFALQWGDFTYTVSGGTITITKYTGTGGVVVIPSTIDGMPVVGIGDSAFDGCSGLTSVTIPNSVMVIRGSAFAVCTSLTSVTIPDSVTSIGNSAFSDSPSLAKAYFLGNAPSMGSQVFYICASNFTVCYTAGSTGFTTPTWYGYPASVCVLPTVINLFFFTATPKSGKVILAWSTESETNNAGFNIYRADSENGEYIKINDSLIPAQALQPKVHLTSL